MTFKAIKVFKEFLRFAGRTEVFTIFSRHEKFKEQKNFPINYLPFRFHSRCVNECAYPRILELPCLRYGT